MGKIFVKVMNRRFVEWSDRAKLLPDEQAGFRRGHSTMDNVLVLDTIVQERLKRGRKTYCAMVDLRQAYDRVNREALWFKLSKMGVSERFLGLMKSMYKNSVFSIKNGTAATVSKAVESRSGVLQGAQNSAALFIHYVADLGRTISELEGSHAPLVGNKEIPCLFFADDICFLSSSVLGLQRMLNSLEKYCAEWNLEVNVKKTKAIVFKKGAKLAKFEKWRYAGEPIEVVRKFNYLGMNFAFNGKWNGHIEEKIRKLNPASRKLLRLGYGIKDCPLKLSLRLFDTLITSSALYGAEVLAWDYAGLEKLAALERKHTRGILGFH